MKKKMALTDPVTQESCNKIHEGTMAEMGKLREEIKERDDKLLAAINALVAKLYHDNGTLSIQTRLDRQARTVSVIVWVLGILAAAVIVELVAFGSATIKYLIRMLPG